MPTGRGVSKEQRDLILRLLAAGLSPNEIKERTGLSLATISKYGKKRA